MDHKLAKRIIATVNECIGDLLETLPAVEAQTSEEEYKAYKRSIARVINTMDLEIVDQVARDFPDLMPEARI